MAKKYKNKKGFLIVSMTRKEALTIWGKYSGVAICDKCNSKTDTGYYVACLNWYLCDKCFRDFIKRAKRYDEDKYYEKIHFLDTVARLVKANLWEE